MQTELRPLTQHILSFVVPVCLAMLLSYGTSEAEAATCSYTNFNIGMEDAAVATDPDK